MPSTTFATASADELWQVWCVAQWPVAPIEQMDEWGHKPDHPEYRLERVHTYISHVPQEWRYLARAQQYAREWNMTPDEVLDMGLADYHRRAMIQKAITTTKPKYEGRQGAIAYRNAIARKELAGYKTPQGALLTEIEIYGR